MRLPMGFLLALFGTPLYLLSSMVLAGILGCRLFLCLLFVDFFRWRIFVMKKITVMTGLWGSLLYVAAGSIAQAETCLATEKVLQLDARYENALRVGDVVFLDKLLAPDFYWVHNLASLKENKTELLVRMNQQVEQPKARRSHDISAQRLDKTVVLQGLSSVDKWNSDGKTFRTLRYQFMRTYVEHNHECKLLAVQTMKVWSSEGVR